MNDNVKSVITCDLDGKVETFSEGAVLFLDIQKKKSLAKCE